LVLISGVILGLAWLRKRIAWGFMPIGLLILTQIIPLYPSPSVRPQGTDSLSVTCINLLSSNMEHELVRQYLAHQGAEVIILQEYNLVWQQALASVVRDYRYRLTVPRSDNFGMAIFSRVPMEDLRAVEVGMSGTPTLLGTCQLGGRAVTLVATHPRPPVGQKQFLERNRHLVGLSELARECQNEVLLLGDLNTSSYSVHFSELLNASGLIDSRVGFGPQTTWPSWGIPFRTTLDHCLHSPGLVTLDRRVGPPVGSDHLPVWVSLGVK
ncbi:MAG: endonuclease/exonuclease/phosphatase family protein, partial [Bacteroidota bacterium]